MAGTKNLSMSGPPGGLGLETGADIQPFDEHSATECGGTDRAVDDNPGFVGGGSAGLGLPAAIRRQLIDVGKCGGGAGEEIFLLLISDTANIKTATPINIAVVAIVIKPLKPKRTIWYTPANMKNSQTASKAR